MFILTESSEIELVTILGRFWKILKKTVYNETSSNFKKLEEKKTKCFARHCLPPFELTSALTKYDAYSYYFLLFSQMAQNCSILFTGISLGLIT